MLLTHRPPACSFVAPRIHLKSRLPIHALLTALSIKGWKHFDLERPSDLQAVSFDPQGLLERHTRCLAIDEAQRLPELFPVLRHAIDQDRRPGRYVLSGSADPRLLKNAGEALTGRIGIIEMTPFLLSELSQRPAWAKARWFWGGFPPIYHLRGVAQRADWLGTWLSTVLEREIPSMGERVPRPRLLRLCQMLAHVHGGLLNVSEIGNSMSLSHHTVTHYLDMLEAAFLIRRLPPYFANIGKRLTKSPKVYIRDTGLLHNLAGLTAPGQLQSWHRLGSSWEGLLIEEIINRASLRYPGAKAYFWRTQAGAEVDLIIDRNGGKTAFEIKFGSAPSTQSLQALRQCLGDLRIRKGYVVYGGKDRRELGGGITLLPWTQILKFRF